MHTYCGSRHFSMNVFLCDLTPANHGDLISATSLGSGSIDRANVDLYSLSLLNQQAPAWDADEASVGIVLGGGGPALALSSPWKAP